MDPNRVIEKYEKYIYDTFRINAESLRDILMRLFKPGDTLYAINIGEVKLLSFKHTLGGREQSGIVVNSISSNKVFFLDNEGALEKGMPTILFPSKNELNWNRYRTFYPKDYEPVKVINKDKFLDDVNEGAKIYLFLKEKLEIYNKYTETLGKEEKGYFSILSIRFRNNGNGNEAYYHIIREMYNPAMINNLCFDNRFRFKSEESAIQFHVNYRDLLYDARFILFYSNTKANYRYDGKPLMLVRASEYQIV